MKALITILICTLAGQSLFAGVNKVSAYTTGGTETGNSFSPVNDTKAALPVLETYIPGNVISAIEQKAGDGGQVYDITAVKAQAGVKMMKDYVYVIRVIKNGTIITERVDANGAIENDTI